MTTAWKKFLITLSAFAIVAGAAAKPPVSSGLVLWFRSGPSTAKFEDLSRNGNRGSATSLMVSNSPSLVSMQDTHQLTLALWIKPNSVPREFPDLISKGGYQTAGAFGGYEMELNANGDNDLIFDSGNFMVDTEHANGSLINDHLGEWIHIAFTIDTVAQTAQFYVDGQPATNSMVVTGSFADVNFNVSNNLYIGVPDPAANVNRGSFDGEMKDIMIFNRALSADEIQKIFSKTQPPGFSVPSGN